MLISIVFYSSTGHVKQIAESIRDGINIKDNNCDINFIQITKDTTDYEAINKILDNSDAILFGCPTYFGSVPGVFKTFLDSTSGRFMKRSWKNKITGGFTNSGGLNGDKLFTLQQLSIFAAQHAMIWVGNEILPNGNNQESLNRTGCWLGLVTQCNYNEPNLCDGDKKTAVLFGTRIYDVTAKFVAL